MQCGSCWGSGTVTCSSCRGRRSHLRLTASDDMDISIFIVCARRGKIKCQFCGGRGTVGPAARLFTSIAKRRFYPYGDASGSELVEHVRNFLP